MSLNENPFGTFFITGVNRSNVPKGGGKNGFPKWTQASLDKAAKAKKAH